MNNNINILAERRVVLFRKDAEGVYEHGESFPQFTFSFIYGSCVARRDRD
jgi:hypothetical protein